jgi:hypothetical protein
MSEVNKVLIIEGIRENGSVFRPSGWAEMVSGVMAGFGRDHRLRYSDELRPCIREGKKCLMLRSSLQEHNPTMYQHILNFAKQNNLLTHEVMETGE